MKNVLVADPVDKNCIGIFESAGLKVDYSTDNSPEKLLEKIKGYNALVVRSSTQVSSDLIAEMNTVEVIGRAGAGVDNIDVPAATRKGILVMNTPGGNTLSAAEHTFAILLSMCRKIPQANQSLKNGNWHRGKFNGTELYGKTLGLIGLGKIGKEVAIRAKAFGLKVISFDPVLSPEVFSKLGIEFVNLDDIWKLSDFISVHTPLNEKTQYLISYNQLLKCKRGVGIINCARGGIIDENDLLKALNEGIVSFAGLDVFEQEPPDYSNNLIKHPLVVCTPHLGASTQEAQKKVAVQIAEQIVKYFNHGIISGAINASIFKDGIPESLKSFLNLSEVVGRMLSQLRKGSLRRLALNTEGDQLQKHNKLLLTAMLKGFLSEELDSPVNYINAPIIAEERGILVEESFSYKHQDYYNLINATIDTNSETFEISGTVFNKSDLRIVKINQYPVEFKPGGHILIYKNIDRPGMLASVSKALSDANINIASLTLGRNLKQSDALTVVNLDSPVDLPIRESILSISGISDVYAVSLKN